MWKYGNWLYGVVILCYKLHHKGASPFDGYTANISKGGLLHRTINSVVTSLLRDDVLMNNAHNLTSSQTWIIRLPNTDILGKDLPQTLWVSHFKIIQVDVLRICLQNFSEIIIYQLNQGTVHLRMNQTVAVIGIPYEQDNKKVDVAWVNSRSKVSKQRISANPTMMNNSSIPKQQNLILIQIQSSGLLRVP